MEQGFFALAKRVRRPSGNSGEARESYETRTGFQRVANPKLKKSIICWLKLNHMLSTRSLIRIEFTIMLFIICMQHAK